MKVGSDFLPGSLFYLGHPKTMNPNNPHLFVWSTEIKALCPYSGELLTWGGPQIEALTMAEAQQWCDENLGYLKVIGRLTMTVPGKRDEEGNHYPDWENRVDLDEGRWN